MANNTAQIFSLHPHIEWCALSAANTALDGTGTVGTCFTATTASGIDSRIERLRFQALGSNIATVARIFVNNGSTNATAANNTLIGEINLPVTTANNAAALHEPVEWPSIDDLNALFPNGLPNGHKINVCLGTAVSAGWQITGFGGHYG